MLAIQRLKELYSYDSETGHFTRLVSRAGKKAGTIAGAINGSGYVLIEIDKKSYKAHRLAWLYMKGGWPEEMIDHINGIRDDNRLSNLRDVSRAENLQNVSRPPRHNKTGYLGVHIDGDRFRAAISHKNRSIYIGTFDNPREAYSAYLKKKREIHSGCTI